MLMMVRKPRRQEAAGDVSFGPRSNQIDNGPLNPDMFTALSFMNDAQCVAHNAL